MLCFCVAFRPSPTFLPRFTFSVGKGVKALCLLPQTRSLLVGLPSGLVNMYRVGDVNAEGPACLLTRQSQAAHRASDKNPVLP